MNVLKETLYTKDKNKETEHPSTLSLYESLVRWATTQPEAAFIVEAETGRVLTYGQALAAVNTLSQYPHADRTKEQVAAIPPPATQPESGYQGRPKMSGGLVSNDRPRNLVVALSGSIVDAMLWLSALSGGHLLVPVSPGATSEEKARIAARHRPDIIFVEEAADGQRFNYPSATVVTRQECEELIGRTSPDGLNQMNAIEGQVCLTTSGTTGEPKGVILSERQIAWTADHIRTSHQLSKQDRGLTVLPFFHVNAPVVSLCSSLLAGSTIVIARRFSRRNFWSWVERYHITWASIVPTIVALLLETERPAFLPGALRFVRTASAPLPASNLRAFEARFGIPVIETYGLSEAASQVTANPVPPGRHKPGSVGLPVGVSLRICAPRHKQNDGKLHDVAEGEVGEICVRGPSLIQSYQHNAGQDAFQEGWFRTGDLGYRDDEGYVFITGRLREMINRGGENIAPREVEEVLLDHPSVREAAVVGRPDPIYGEQVVAYVMVWDNWSVELAQDLRQYAAQRLSPPKVPVDVIALDEMPKNATGKIERRLLRAREQAQFGNIR